MLAFASASASGITLSASFEKSFSAFNRPSDMMRACDSSGLVYKSSREAWLTLCVMSSWL